MNNESVWKKKMINHKFFFGFRCPFYFYPIPYDINKIILYFIEWNINNNQNIFSIDIFQTFIMIERFDI